MERIYAAERAAEAADSSDDEEGEEGDEDDDEEGARDGRHAAAEAAPHGGEVSAQGGLRILLTTNGGLEAVVREEVIEASRAAGVQPPVDPAHVVPCPWGCYGRVLVSRPPSLNAATPMARGPACNAGMDDGSGSGSGALLPNEPVLESALLRLRTVHDVLWHHAVLPLPETSDPPLALYESVRAMPLADGGPCTSLEGGTHSFRVSCVREGEHQFTSLDIERELGGALHELCALPQSVNLRRRAREHGSGRTAAPPCPACARRFVVGVRNSAYLPHSLPR